MIFVIRSKEVSFPNASIAYVLAIRWTSATKNLYTHLVIQNIQVDLAFPTRVGILAVVASIALQAMEVVETHLVKNARMGMYQHPVPTLHKPNFNN
ncbi:hypothetical protein glysoja_041538 [Glycine soja]|uniref:Uncharacterized protein n=1 Tax=Glycine soja TaxID=3848 RepID=A0A0B2RPK8_GLYSO|nr:hypothetical protein glysoja_041538 [Glycine soja]